jgi:hypothetical protein
MSNYHRELANFRTTDTVVVGVYSITFIILFWLLPTGVVVVLVAFPEFVGGKAI